MNTEIPSTNGHIIEFFLWEDDDLLEIQLEPEAIIFMVEPGNSIKFIAINCVMEFSWVVRISGKENGLQLFPESKGDHDIEIYENGALLDNWYKYM
ncbi:hypothetical protein G7092_14640 [Mucilaginibacter sp. HC2]|uniref:hypothetical protein n=1 Tax=Mucilaginibacter inviolabilis TaxID=2714892 RepID=UPI00140E03E5|nr:hypothetical protein [Mucilaginibacter inviolabilis]NHA05044.1 hypothetical protein [Mucilaginibacter inviolabilis]